MIKINLAIAPKHLDWRRIGLMITGAAIIVATALYVTTWFVQTRRIADDQRAVEQVLNEYKTVTAREAEIKAREVAMDQAEQALSQIRLNQGNRLQSPLLTAILAAVPPDLRVSSVAVQNDGSIVIKGTARQFAASITYMNTLRAMRSLVPVAEREVTVGDSGETAFTFLAKAPTAGLATEGAKP